MAQAPNRRRSIVEMLATLPQDEEDGLDYGLGPVTPMSRAGMTPEALQGSELRNVGSYDAVNPLHERIGTGILDYGSAPAKAFADQAGRAGESISDFQNDPSLPNFGSMAMNTGLAVAPVSLKAAAIPAAGVVGGLIEAGRRTFAPDILGGADAQQTRKQPPPQVMSGRKWEDLLATAGGDEALARTWAAMGPKALGEALGEHAKNSPAAIRARGEAEAAAQAARDKQAADAAAVRRAGQAYDDVMATDKSWVDTDYAKYTKALGGTDPYVWGGVAGILARMAGHKNPLGIMAGGAAGGFGAGNASLLYDAGKTPALNPKREALEAYDRELPLDHDEKGKRTEFAAQMPRMNPIREQALEQLDYTQWPNIVRGGVNALEGALTALPGAHLVETGPRIASGVSRVAEHLATNTARLPGTAYRNFVDAFKRPPPTPPQTIDQYKYKPDSPSAEAVLERAYRRGGPADRDQVSDAVIAAGQSRGRNFDRTDIEQRVRNATRAIEGSGLDLKNPAQRTQAIRQSTGKALGRNKTLGLALGAGMGADLAAQFADGNPIARMLAEREGY